MYLNQMFQMPHSGMFPSQGGPQQMPMALGAPGYGGFGGGPKTGMVPFQLPPGFGGAPQPMPQPGFAGQPGFPGSPGFGGNPFSALMSMMQAQGGPQMQGMTSGASGSRGPAASPYLGLQRFMGPFGNGGGPIAPSFQSGFGMQPGFSGGGASPQGMGLRQWY